MYEDSIRKEEKGQKPRSPTTEMLKELEEKFFELEKRVLKLEKGRMSGWA